MKYGALSLRLALKKPNFLSRFAPDRQAVRTKILSKLRSGEYRQEVATCLCGHCSAEVLSRFDKHRLPFPLVICKQCGTARLGKRLTKQTLSLFYDNEYRPLYNPGYRDSFEKYKEQISNPPGVLDHLLEVIPHGVQKIVDIGCHFGNLAFHLHKHGYDVSGIDYDSHATSFAREELGIDCKVGGIDVLSQNNQSFDLVTYIHVLEHINELDEELQKIQKIIRENGYLYLSVPGLFNWIEKKKNNILNTIQCAHSWYFTLSSLVYVVERNGFQLVTGDEKVNALFKKLPFDKQNVEAPNEYHANYTKLFQIERRFLENRLGSFVPSAAVKLLLM
jgi:2-polyprenyl-3-methyl-5-hydroxy-6-metoxy-1,4-benzoquinol methylase